MTEPLSPDLTRLGDALELTTAADLGDAAPAHAQPVVATRRRSSRKRRRIIVIGIAAATESPPSRWPPTG